jgi:UDP-glucose 4-epimerase
MRILVTGGAGYVGSGDPPILVAGAERAAEILHWRPRRGTIDEIIGSAWAWRRANPEGYADPRA